MHLNGIPFERLDETHLSQLVTDQVTENRVLEFKQTLPGASADEKAEFTRDVAAFANSAGGHIVYGIKETDGVATAIAPIPLAEADAATQRMEQIIRANIEPTIHGLRIETRAVPNGCVIIVEIPKGLFGPHMIKGRRAFLVRGSAGKAEMDFGEIRAAFTGAEAATQRMQEFYTQRVASISLGDTPQPLAGNQRIALHLCSLASFTPGFGFNMAEISEALKNKLFPPRPYSGWGPSYCMDGYLETYGPIEARECYSLCFRNGILEAVHSTYLQPEQEWVGALADWFLFNGNMLLDSARALNLPTPLYFFASLVNVRGLKLLPSARARFLCQINEEHLLPSALAVEDLDVPLATQLRPLFDLFWNGCGVKRCPRYDAEGAYKDEGLHRIL